MADFRLPPDFVNNVNKASKGLADFHAARTDTDRNKALADLFCSGCILLNSINLLDLETALNDLRKQGEEIGWDKLDETFAKQFDQFLIVESAALRQIGIDERAREHIVGCILDLRRVTKIEPAFCIQQLETLTTDLCHYCREYHNPVALVQPSSTSFRTVWNYARRLLSGALVVGDAGLLTLRIIDPITATLSVQLGQATMEIFRASPK